MAKKAEKAPAEEVALEGEAPKKSKKKLIIMIVILLVLLGALGGGGYFGYKWWMGKKAAPAAAENATEQKAEGHGAPAEGGGHGDKKDAAGVAPAADSGTIVSIPPLLVNLADPQGRRYLKIALDIEMKDKLAGDELNKNMFPVILTCSPKALASWPCRVRSCSS